LKSKESGPGAYLELLAELKSALEEMRSATRDQLEALKAGDRQGIWKAVYRQEDLILRLAELEERRCSLQAALEEELGLPAGAPLSEVCSTSRKKKPRPVPACTPACGTCFWK
jgi:hypothetical protein